MRVKPVPLTPSRYAGYEGDAYELVTVIGRGAFGLVTLMTSEHSGGKLVAMKTVDRFRLTTPALRKAVAHEIRLLRAIVPPHAGIVPLLEVIETCRSIHMVFEFASGGTLHNFVAERGALGEGLSRPLARQLCAAVAHLHAHRVCHRDLKLDNLVLDEAGSGGSEEEEELAGASGASEGAEECAEAGGEGEASGSVVEAAFSFRVRIIDFGLSTTWPQDDATPMRKVAGSLAYMAPEMVARRSYRGDKVDAWSIGVCVAAMLGGVLPFYSETDEDLKSLILSGDYTLPPAFAADDDDDEADDDGDSSADDDEQETPPLSAESLQFVARLLTLEPAERCNMTDALRHAWLQRRVSR